MLTFSYYIQSTKWIIPAGFMLGSAPTFYTVWGAWRILSCVLPRRVYEAGDEFLYSLYQKLVLFFFESCSGTEIFLYGDHKEALSKKENVIFICNHQCTVDWLIANVLAVRQGSIGNIRYILKDGLKYLPLYGFYFRQHSCVYVKRSGKFNETKADNQLRMFVKNKTPFWMVIFPEGTRYNPNLPKVIEKSREFAKNQGLPAFEHVLCPRSKALRLCIDNLRPAASAIYDVSVGYSNTLGSKGKRTAGPSLADFLQGVCPQVHIHLKRIDIDEVPNDENKLQDWLMNRFVEKDRMLKTFYGEDERSELLGSFGSGGQRSRLSLASTLPAFAFFVGVNAPFLLTEVGRALYWRLALAGTLFSWFWMSIRN